MPVIPDNPLQNEIVYGAEGNSRYHVTIDAPEATHVLLWMRLRSHSADGNMDLSNPPHLPLESYGRVWFVSPKLGTTRGA